MCGEILENESLYRGRYRILRKIGSGGTSTVYMGFDNKTGMTVSIKKLRQEIMAGGAAYEAVKQEAKLLEGLRNSAIPGLVEVYEDAVVLEHIPGNTLDKYLRAKGHLKEQEAVQIGREILEVLGYLHELEEPVIYRDLKPSNIVIRPDGHVALIDFGAARVFRADATSDEMNVGTCGFAAPEQYGSLGQTDVRTDVYCFGKTMEQILGENGGSPELQAVLDKCTRPDRDDRFGSCREIEEALEKCPKRAAVRRIMKNVKLAAVAALVALVVTVTSTYHDAVMSYAASDAQVRIPAVKQRLGYAGIRIRDLLEEHGIQCNFLEDR